MKRSPERRDGRRSSSGRIPCGLFALALALPAGAAMAAPAASEQAAAQHAPVAPEAGHGAADGALHYLRITGSAFHPVDGTTAFSYAGAGCINRTGTSTSLFTHKVVLPAGSVVRSLRLYYYDTSSSSITAFLTTYDQLGHFNQRVSVTSSPATGYGNVESVPIHYVVDPYLEPVVVTVNMDASVDASLQFCGVRIAYSDDTIFSDGFD